MLGGEPGVARLLPARFPPSAGLCNLAGSPLRNFASMDSSNLEAWRPGCPELGLGSWMLEANWGDSKVV